MCYNNKEWRRIRKEIDLPVQNWHDEFNKFWHEHLKEQKLYTLMGWFWRKYAMFEIQKYKEVVFYDTREWCKIWFGKCGLERSMKNLANFHQSTWKSQNWDFYGVLLSKVENVWAQNLLGSYVL